MSAQEARCPDTSHEVQYVTIHGHRRAFVKVGERAGRPAAARPRLRPHDLGAGDRHAGPALHRDRPRPARARRVRQAARRLQRGRLRQRHARPADRARHRQGHRGRPQLRRRRRDAVRLPVPRAHRAARAGRHRRPRPRGEPGIRAITTPGFHQAMGVLDPARRTPRGSARPAGAVRSPTGSTPATSTRSPRSTTRSATPPPGTRSGTSSAPSSTGAARSSPWPTVPTSPTRCRCA